MTKPTPPKFIVALSNAEGDPDWIVHTEFPRFIAANVTKEDDELEVFEVVEWIDDPPPTIELAKLMRMAGEAFERECSKIE